MQWYFPTGEEFGGKLDAHGFRVESSTVIPRPTPLDSGMSAWLKTFTRYMLEGVAEERAAQIENYTVELLRPSLCDASGNWTADYTRLRFAARA